MKITLAWIRGGVVLCVWLMTPVQTEAAAALPLDTTVPGYGTRIMGTTNTSGYGADLNPNRRADIYRVAGERWGVTGDERVRALATETDRESRWDWIGWLGLLGLIGLAGRGRQNGTVSKMNE